MSSYPKRKRGLCWCCNACRPVRLCILKLSRGSKLFCAECERKLGYLPAFARTGRPFKAE